MLLPTDTPNHTSVCSPARNTHVHVKCLPAFIPTPSSANTHTAHCCTGTMLRPYQQAGVHIPAQVVCPLLSASLLGCSLGTCNGSCTHSHSPHRFKFNPPGSLGQAPGAVTLGRTLKPRGWKQLAGEVAYQVSPLTDKNLALAFPVWGTHCLFGVLGQGPGNQSPRAPHPPQQGAPAHHSTPDGRSPGWPGARRTAGSWGCSRYPGATVGRTGRRTGARGKGVRGVHSEPCPRRPGTLPRGAPRLSPHLGVVDHQAVLADVDSVFEAE